MKCIVLDGYALNPGDISWSEFEAQCELEIYDRTEPRDVVARCQGVSLVLTNKTVLSEAVLKQLPALKYVGVLATGYNVVDVVAAKALGITVTNVPTYGTNAVSQFVFALLLEICHNVGKHAKSVADGEWSNCKDFTYWHYPLMELTGKTMGIIGTGRIGMATAKIAVAFGMKVIAHDAYPNLAYENESFKYCALDELYSEADVISLHCPLFESTRGMINRESISRMKDGVILINTSRGPLIVDADLAEGLNSGKVFAAAVDVLDEEPPRPDNPLLKAKNCIVTPHIAWAPKESRERLMTIAAENLKGFLVGNRQNVVNP